MGNKHQTAPVPEADTFEKAQVLMNPGTIITPVAENSEAIVYSTKFQTVQGPPIAEPRELQSVLSQNHGQYIVRPKNALGLGKKVLQVKSLNPQPTKLYYIVRKQEGVDKWLEKE